MAWWSSYKIFSQAVGAAEIIPTRHNVARAQQAPEDLPADLLRAEAVLGRRDIHEPLLAPLYDGPFHMLTRSRDFWFQMEDRTDTVSTSHIKPCLDPAAACRIKDVPRASRGTSPSAVRPWSRRRQIGCAACTFCHSCCAC
jgi:hypothetical protein